MGNTPAPQFDWGNAQPAVATAPAPSQAPAQTPATGFDWSKATSIDGSTQAPASAPQTTFHSNPMATQRTTSITPAKQAQQDTVNPEKHTPVPAPVKAGMVGAMALGTGGAALEGLGAEAATEAAAGYGAEAQEAAGLEGAVGGEGSAAVPSYLERGATAAKEGIKATLDAAGKVAPWVKANPGKAVVIETIAREIGVDPFQLMHKILKYGNALFQ